MIKNQRVTNMKIVPTKYYSLLEVQKFTGIKSRQYLSRYIDEGYLLAIQTGSGTRLRYAILGAWVTEFIERYRAGLIKKVSDQEMMSIIKMTVAYCEKSGILTIEELRKKIK